MIEYTLEFLASNGVEEVFVFCCAHAEQIVEYIEKSAWSAVPGFVVHTIVSTNCISAGEAMRLIDHRHVVRADFILVSGDVVANMDLKRALEAHLERRKTEKLAIMTMCFQKLGQRLREERLGESNLVVVTDPENNRVLHYDEHPSPSAPAEGHSRPKLPPLSLGASLFSDHVNLRVRTDLRDCHVDICAPEVLYLFTDNFDYQHLRRDFVVGTLNERELGNNIYAHELGPKEYAASVSNLRSYDAVSRDVIGRWVYPLSPDVNCLEGRAYHLRAQMAADVRREGCRRGPLRDDRSGDGARRRVLGGRGGARVRGVRARTRRRRRRGVRRGGFVSDGERHSGRKRHDGGVHGVRRRGGARGRRGGEGRRALPRRRRRRRPVVPDYARLSLAEQPEANDDEYDSDEDGLEVGSFPNERRVSMTRDASGGSLGSDDEDAAGGAEWRSGRRNANSSREPNAETSAEPKTPRACGPRTAWAWEARDTRGRRGGARRSGDSASPPRQRARPGDCVRRRRRVGL